MAVGKVSMGQAELFKEREENKMKLALVKVSDDFFEKDVEINTVEELFELMDEYGGHDLILSKNIGTEIKTSQGTVYEEVWGIRIYDDCIE